MACHDQGMWPFKDTLRENSAVGGTALEAVRRLYAPHDEMDRLLKQDTDKFMGSFRRVLEPYPRVAEDKDVAVDGFAEPIGEVARSYLLKPVGVEMAAYELGIQPGLLPGMIQGSKTLRELGLGPLADGKPLKREEWKILEGGGDSLFQQVARELQLGTPIRP